MNKIVKHHYPASNLPDDLREGLDPAQEVRVTIEVVESGADAGIMRLPERTKSLDELFAMRRAVYPSKDAVDAHIRALRDEWD
jgi:hypothetical protein